MPFMNLPTEMVIIIAKSLDDNRDLAMLARTCRFLYNVANPILYARNAKNEGSSALLWAGKTGSMETAKLCIKYGANVDTYADDLRTPLILAADNGHVKLAEVLLACPGTYISECDVDGNSATFLAAKNDDPEMLDLLLHHGADADQVHRDGMGLLHIPDLSIRAMQILLRYGANPGQMDSAGKTPLTRAVKSGSIPHVALLLDWSAGDMTGPADLQDDPLAMALDHQDEDILRLLLKHGVQNSFALTLQVLLYSIRQSS
jgi:ankyrin repeat protein